MSKNGFGSKTSSEKNYLKLLKDSFMNVQDLDRKGGDYSKHWMGSKKSK